MTLFGCDNTLNIASTDYVDCVVTTVSGHLQEQINPSFPNKYSMYFDGSGDWLERVNVNSNEIGSQKDLTCNAWVLVQSGTSAHRGIFDFDGGSNAGDTLNWTINNNDSERRLYLDMGPGTATETVNFVYNKDVWYMFSVTVNNTQYKHYVNGVLQTNLSVDDSVQLNSNKTATFYIAADADLKGFVRHVSIHEGQLSASELLAMYNNGTAIDLRNDQGNYTESSNLLHYWFLGDDDDLGPSGVLDRAGDLNMTAAGNVIVTLNTPHRV